MTLSSDPNSYYKSGPVRWWYWGLAANPVVVETQAQGTCFWFHVLQSLCTLGHSCLPSGIRTPLGHLTPFLLSSPGLGFSTLSLELQSFSIQESSRELSMCFQPFQQWSSGYTGVVPGLTLIWCHFPCSWDHAGLISLYQTVLTVSKKIQWKERDTRAALPQDLIPKAQS